MKSDSPKLRRRASVVCVHDGKVLLVKLRDPSTKVLRLFPPGGEIEPGESAEQAAIRECLEETCCMVELIDDSRIDDHYDFTWNGQIYRCHTSYFLAKLIRQNQSTVDDAVYNEGFVWLPLSDVRNELKFDLRILECVQKLIDLNI